MHDETTWEVGILTCSRSRRLSSSRYASTARSLTFNSFFLAASGALRRCSSNCVIMLPITSSHSCANTSTALSAVRFANGISSWRGSASSSTPSPASLSPSAPVSAFFARLLWWTNRCTVTSKAAFSPSSLARRRWCAFGELVLFGADFAGRPLGPAGDGRGLEAVGAAFAFGFTAGCFCVAGLALGRPRFLFFVPGFSGVSFGSSSSSSPASLELICSDFDGLPRPRVLPRAAAAAASSISSASSASSGSACGLGGLPGLVVVASSSACVSSCDRLGDSSSTSSSGEPLGTFGDAVFAGTTRRFGTSLPPLDCAGA